MAEGIGGGNDPRLILLLQQYGELLILNSSEVREKTKKMAKLSLDDLQLIKSPQKKGRVKSARSSANLYKLASSTVHNASASTNSSASGIVDGIEGTQLTETDAPPGQINLGDDVTRGLALLTRAVQIAKVK